MKKALRNKPLFKIYYRYKNIYLWKNKSISNLNKKKWNGLKANLKRKFFKFSKHSKYNGIYTCHYKKLKLERLYYYKFINKQILRKYLVNYKEFNFKHYLLLNYLTFEKRLDFNLYKANFVTNLYAARFYIAKGCVFVNKKRITYVNYLLSANDLVEIDKTLYTFVRKYTRKLELELKYYPRNMEIDYKTYSFIFLAHKNFYVTDFTNFVKKINYCKKATRTISLVTPVFDYSQKDQVRSINKLNNNYNFNNYFKFIEHIYHYYLFLDKQNKFLNYPSIKYVDKYQVMSIFKYIKSYYTNYFFRNILLKHTFIAKYNYLMFLQKNNLFNNYYEFENINKTFNKNLKITPTSTVSLNTLHSDFFRYYINLIFKFYYYLSKNYYINQYNFTLLDSITTYSINAYKFTLFFNKKIFNLLRIKNNLNSLFLIKNKTNKIVTITKNQYKNYKIIYNSRTFKQSSVFNNLSRQTYFSIMRYLSSKKAKIRIFRRCKSLKENRKKRVIMAKRLNESFNHQYFNKVRIATDSKIFTNTILYNKLKVEKTKRLKRISKYKLFRKIKYIKYKRHFRFQKREESYIKVETINLHFKKLPALYKKFLKFNNSSNEYFKNKLIIKLRILNNNNICIRKLPDFKFDTNKKSFSKRNTTLRKKLKKRLSRLTGIKGRNNKQKIRIKRYYKFYLVMSLIKSYKHKLQTYNLIRKPFTILHKIYFNKQTQHKLLMTDYTTKHLRSELRKFKQFQKNPDLIKRQNRYLEKTLNNIRIPRSTPESCLGHSYIKYKKLKTSIPSNLKKYFLIKTYKNISVDSYKCYKNFRKFYFLSKNFVPKTDSQKQYHKQLIAKLLTKFHISTPKPKNIFYNFNMKLINKKYHFQDNLFFIDLILNLSIRKLNLNYNKLIYKNKKLSKQDFNSFEISNISSIRSKKIRKSLAIKNKYNYISCKYHYRKDISKTLFRTSFNNFKVHTKIKKYKHKVLKLFNKNLAKNITLVTYYYNYNKFITKQYKKLKKLIFSKHNKLYYDSKRLHFIKFQKRSYINNIYKTYMYYLLNIKKYKLIKFIFNNYILKEYKIFTKHLLTKYNCKTHNRNYILQLYYNLLFTKFFNLTQFDSILQSNFTYSRNLQIIINYFILIKRLYY